MMIYAASNMINQQVAPFSKCHWCKKLRSHLKSDYSDRTEAQCFELANLVFFAA